MTFRRLILRFSSSLSQFAVLSFALISFMLHPALSPAQDATLPSPASNTSITTESFQPKTFHIESNPWRTIIVEREPNRPIPSDLSTTWTEASNLHLNWLGLVNVDFTVDTNPASPGYKKPNFARFSVIKIPFIELWGTTPNGILYAPRDWVYDSHHQLTMDWYFFALFNFTLDGRLKTTHNDGYGRVAIFDSPLIFTGYRYQIDGPDYRYWEALDLPLSSTISHLKDKEMERWKVLNIPFFRGYWYERKGGNEDKRILSVFPDISAYQQSNSANRNFAALFRGPVVGSGPLFFLYQGGWENDQSRPSNPIRYESRQFLRIPLLGPLAAWWKGGKYEGFHILPRIFNHKTAPESIRQG